MAVNADSNRDTNAVDRCNPTNVLGPVRPFPASGRVLPEVIPGHRKLFVSADAGAPAAAPLMAGQHGTCGMGHDQRPVATPRAQRQRFVSRQQDQSRGSRQNIGLVRVRQKSRSIMPAGSCFADPGEYRQLVGNSPVTLQPFDERRHAPRDNGRNKRSAAFARRPRPRLQSPRYRRDTSNDVRVRMMQPSSSGRTPVPRAMEEQPGNGNGGRAQAADGRAVRREGTRAAFGRGTARPLSA